MNSSYLLHAIESHAALVQALSGVVAAAISAAALVWTAMSLRAVQRQTDASIAATTETFRPIVEVMGGSFGALRSELILKNKGSGSALNLRWRLDQEPAAWCAGAGNVLLPHEETRAIVAGDVRGVGLVMSYESVAQKGELLTYVQFSTSDCSPYNQHSFKTKGAVTRNGWTIADPELAIPAWHPDAIAKMPPIERLRHWWRLKRGRERRL